MALPNKDEIQGKWEQAKGAVKEGIGKLTNDPDTELEGQAQQTGGEAQEGWGKFKRGVSETVQDIGKTVGDLGKSANK
jgi:uncharacterized protein YjbJ (UPF0337 family)